MGQRVLFVVGAGVTIIFGIRPVYAQGDSMAGRKLYRAYCSPCHGESGKGDGQGARLLPVRPADHTDGTVMNKHTNKYLVGRSPYMPAWGGQLREGEMRDLIRYIRSLAVPAYKAEGK
ncbi:MAG: cytochrome c [Deltaproteobacteria bacterium]|nr:cytochrome c [Deltaproteobacteria bacterium]